MSSHVDFLTEKLQVDDLVKKGYIMTGSKGTLDGDVVEFENKTTFDKKTMLLTNPDSRKYYTTLYIKQLSNSKISAKKGLERMNGRK
ncbi:hypothetical protein KFZ58_06075 [Virgibacillus sp. NKC19-16]|uniref:hypothetical protein n=1 Tax=Virgibacillus salidurans TaxID=2831673 RepID=UPI001F423D64|nr:hypothetical protein [Virgibacillus sp. NKC19-16]UJL47447.1 hypothetical protein KFZ58_06075 [Virgibacillus sp. NKC19-16]